MSIGEVAKIHCSPDYAYGAGGFPAWGIQPNSELVRNAVSSDDRVFDTFEGSTPFAVYQKTKLSRPFSFSNTVDL